MTWAEALRYCREKYTDLASVHNEEELNKLKTTASRYYKGHVWLGLYDNIDSWKWSLEEEGYYGDGEAEFGMWNSGKPNNKGGYENCVQMEDNGFWSDVVCETHQKFVCYNGKENTS